MSTLSLSLSLSLTLTLTLTRLLGAAPRAARRPDTQVAPAVLSAARPHGHSASSSQQPTRPPAPLQRPARVRKAALWARGESNRRVDAEVWLRGGTLVLPAPETRDIVSLALTLQGRRRLSALRPLRPADLVRGLLPGAVRTPRQV